jgi:CubicO group peptidase (beta-lactamase class C family)
MLNIKNHCLLCLLLITAQACLNRSHASNINTADLQQIARTIAAQYHELGWFSGSLLITHNNQPVVNLAYGLQDQSSQQANTPNTRYNLGSIMKDLTRILVLQQIEAGKLRMDDPLERFELGFADAQAQQVTIAQLLNHRSGFKDLFVAAYREDPLAFDSLQKKFQLLKDEPLLFPPGSEQRYSNYGYIVLGVILEQLSGQSFAALLNQRILKPLKMNNTTFFVNAQANNQSTRHTYLYNNSLKAVGVTEHPGPDGGLESTTADVQRLYHALFNDDRLLNRNSELFINTFPTEQRHWGSYGGGLGVSAAVEVDLKHNLTIIVLANSDQLVAERISGRIHSWVRQGSFPLIKPLAKNLAYAHYTTHGKQAFYQQFRDHYADQGYQQFIGRPINELGMQLLKNQAHDEAMDVFGYLLHLFPEAPQAYDSLAFAHLSMGNSVLARQAFAKALRLQATFNSDYDSQNYGVEHLYLNQPPPGNTPQLFAPDLVSGAQYTYGATFSPDLKTLYFRRKQGPDTQMEYVSWQYHDHRWHMTVLEGVAGQPFFAPDGQRLHLGRRFKERTADGWSPTQELGQPYADLQIMRMTSSNHETWVFDEVGSAEGDGVLRYSDVVDGIRQPPKAFGPNINTGTFKAHPFIAPDESYLIWDARRQGGQGDADIYISFRQSDGHWGPAINLGPTINSAGWDAAASITPDGQYLFFHRLNEHGNANIYWVDARFIEQLRPAE